MYATLLIIKGESTMAITTTTKTETTELESILQHFTGTDQFYRFSGLSRLVITDGVKYLCEKANAYWLMDIIASYQSKCNKDEMLRYFQIWTLNVEDGAGKVICERDTNDIAITQKIPYTDFPLASIKMYCENGVICLPSER